MDDFFELCQVRVTVNGLISIQIKCVIVETLHTALTAICEHSIDMLHFTEPSAHVDLMTFVQLRAPVQILGHPIASTSPTSH